MHVDEVVDLARERIQHALLNGRAQRVLELGMTGHLEQVVVVDRLLAHIFQARMQKHAASLFAVVAVAGADAVAGRLCDHLERVDIGLLEKHDVSALDQLDQGIENASRFLLGEQVAVEADHDEVALVGDERALADHLHHDFLDLRRRGRHPGAATTGLLDRAGFVVEFTAFAGDDGLSQGIAGSCELGDFRQSFVCPGQSIGLNAGIQKRDLRLQVTRRLDESIADSVRSF